MKPEAKCGHAQRAAAPWRSCCSVHELEDARRALAQPLHRRRVRDAQVARRVERLAGGTPRAPSRAAPARTRRTSRCRRVEHPGDVREQIERALRLHALEAGIRRQPALNVVAPGPVLVEHRADRLLRAGQRRSAAFCVIDVMFDVVCPWIMLKPRSRPPSARSSSRSASRSSRTPSTPSPQNTARSRCRSNSTFGGCAARSRRSAARSRGRR